MTLSSPHFFRFQRLRLLSSGANCPAAPRSSMCISVLPKSDCIFNCCTSLWPGTSAPSFTEVKKLAWQRRACAMDASPFQRMSSCWEILRRDDWPRLSGVRISVRARPRHPTHLLGLLELSSPRHPATRRSSHTQSVRERLKGGWCTRKVRRGNRSLVRLFKPRERT